MTVESLGALSSIGRFLITVAEKFQKRRKQDGPDTPVQTLRIALKQDRDCWWHMGKIGDDPSMQIVGSVFATNISTGPARILQVELHYGLWGRKRLTGKPMVSRGTQDNMHGMYDIPPGATRNATFDFWLHPPVVKAADPFTAHSVVFIDQFQNRHVLKRVRFMTTASKPTPPSQEPEEFPYQISDPITREIVSVLKAEMSRYEINGRSSGGLGSIHVTYQGTAIASIGGDSWKPNSPVSQLIVSNPEAAVLKSDNLDALSNFYETLLTKEKQMQFKITLLQRLNEKHGYLSVSYFIVCTLWRVGALDEALHQAKRLPTGESRVFGLSNVLMLLNGLLRYRHPDFTKEMLDEIERLVHSLSGREHPFLILNKIASIRSRRLSEASAAAAPPARPAPPFN